MLWNYHKLCYSVWISQCGVLSVLFMYGHVKWTLRIVDICWVPLRCGLKHSGLNDIYFLLCCLTQLSLCIIALLFHPITHALCVFKSRTGSTMFELVPSPARETTSKPAPSWWPSTLSRLVRPTVTFASCRQTDLLCSASALFMLFFSPSVSWRQCLLFAYWNLIH